VRKAKDLAASGLTRFRSHWEMISRAFLILAFPNAVERICCAALFSLHGISQL
jgi:hypothetical protein